MTDISAPSQKVKGEKKRGTESSGGERITEETMMII